MKQIILIFICMALMQVIFAQSNNDNQVTIIKQLRTASNEAIARHDINALSTYWMDDLVLVRGNSTHLTGKDAIVSEWKKLFHDNPTVSYVRTTTDIIISKNDTLAWEMGTWKAVNSYSHGGNYSAMWKKTNNSWKILAELFVSLF